VTGYNRGIICSPTVGYINYTNEGETTAQSEVGYSLEP
jgi:hypothetical protein